MYTEREGISFGNKVIPQNNNAYSQLGATTDESYEGTESLYFDFDNIDSWGAMGTLLADGGSADISAYANGTYHVALKTTCDKIMLLRLQSGGSAQKAIITLDPSEEPYGLKRDGEWHLLEIPIQDFISANADLDLADISELLVFRSGETDVKADDDWDWYLDDLYLSVDVN
jgi:hypothetical protein